MQNIKSLALRMFWTPIHWDVHVFPIHIKYKTEFNYYFSVQIVTSGEEWYERYLQIC